MLINERINLFSVVIPVYNRKDTLKQTLTSVFASDYKDFEVIVVNDGSSDMPQSVTDDFPCKLINLEINRGAAAARNTGAKAANGDILLFIDSDVVIDKDTLSRFYKAFAETSSDAIVGIYGKKMDFYDPFSIYKNLFLYFSQNNRCPRFWTGCAAVKKDIFLKLGGFDEKQKGASVEDTAFGYLLGKYGYKIKVSPDIQVTHHHRYTLSGLVKNDFLKTVDWIKLAFGKNNFPKTEGYYLNPANFISLFCVFLSAVLIPFVFFRRDIRIVLAGCILIFLALNINFFVLLIKKAGLRYAVLGPLIHILAYMTVISGVIYGTAGLFKPYPKNIF